MDDNRTFLTGPGTNATRVRDALASLCGVDPTSVLLYPIDAHWEEAAFYDGKTVLQWHAFETGDFTGEFEVLLGGARLPSVSDADVFRRLAATLGSSVLYADEDDRSLVTPDGRVSRPWVAAPEEYGRDGFVLRAADHPVWEADPLPRMPEAHRAALQAWGAERAISLSRIARLVRRVLVAPFRVMTPEAWEFSFQAAPEARRTDRVRVGHLCFEVPDHVVIGLALPMAVSPSGDRVFLDLAVVSAWEKQAAALGIPRADLEPLVERLAVAALAETDELGIREPMRTDGVWALQVLRWFGEEG